MNSYIAEQKQIIKQEQLIDDIIEKGGYCSLCGYSDNPLLLENHHIAGKNNSNITIALCPTCHMNLTKDQSAWNKDWTKKSNSPRKVMAFMLRGISDILKLISGILRQYSEDMLKGED